LGIDDRVKETFVLVVMEKLVNLSDEQLKKENTDATGTLISTMGNIYHNVLNASSSKNNNSQRIHEVFYQFWLKMILKFVNSSSLVVKLFGWEQLNELIAEIKSVRPLPSSFIIDGAGTEFVNGTYNVSGKAATADAECLQYTKATNQPGVPLLTLFRCTMRNTKAKWWFISQADMDKPGTDKDIDYYLHKSTPDDEREPPSVGWTRNNPGMNLVGVDPPPVLKRGNVLLPKGVLSKEACVDYKFIEWCLSNDILSVAFSSSIHRETVTRSLKYLLFLVEYDVLKADHLKLIWKSAIHSNDHDVMEEIFFILVQLSPLLSSSLFSYLMDLVEETLKTDDHFSKVIHFIERYSTDDYKYLNAVHSAAMQTRFLSLLWVLYMSPTSGSSSPLPPDKQHHTLHHGHHPPTLTMKDGLVIQDLLSFCFRQRGGKEMALERIKDCVSKLEELAVAEVVDESIAGRMIQTLYFLISKHHTVAAPLTGSAVVKNISLTATTEANSLVEELDKMGFIPAVVLELRRFIVTNRKKAENDEHWYVGQLSSRFQVLRKYYVISHCDDLRVIEDLWNLTKENPCELEEFFIFLRGNSSSSSSSFASTSPSVPSSSSSGFEPIFSNIHLLTVFTTILCSDTIDWATCGEGAFDCFRSYVSELEGLSSYVPQGTELPPRLGLPTLWRIVLTSSSTRVQENSTDLLLIAYEALAQKGQSVSEIFNEFLRIIFDEFQVYLNKVVLLSASPSSVNEKETLSSARKTERCLSVLTTAIQRFGAGNGISHAASSCMSRITISVYYRRVSYHYNPQTHIDSLRADKGTDGVIKLEVHPYHTVKLLKMKIAEIVRCGSPSNLTVDNQFQRVFNDFTRLYELNITEGQEVSVAYQLPTFQRNNFNDDLYGQYNTSYGGGGGKIFKNESLSAPNSTFSFGQLLSEDYSKFDCLFSLCQAATQLSNNVIANRVWELLQLLPTQADLLGLVRNTIDEPQPSEKIWKTIFDTTNTARRTYLLQIIDTFLHPAPEVDIGGKVEAVEVEGNAGDSTDKNGVSLLFKDKFLKSYGMHTILELFLSTSLQADSDNNDITFVTLAECLNILYVSVFNSSNLNENSAQNSSGLNDESLAFLINLDERSSSKLLEMLLYVAHHASIKENSTVVHSALVIITLLIRSPTAASILINKDYSKALLATVLKSRAKKVREIASNFAIQVGKVQPIVFRWLLQELQLIQFNDNGVCTDLFYALSFLLNESQFISTEDNTDRQELAAILSEKILAFRQLHSSHSTSSSDGEKYALLGFLNLLYQLLSMEPSAVFATPLGSSLVDMLLKDFLFVLNQDQDLHHDSHSNNGAICDTPATRKAAFQVLAYLIKYSSSIFEDVLKELMKLTKQAGKQMHYFWGLQVSNDIKKNDTKLVGLKNQGCTCYSNSLLQCLFMTPKFRDAIMETPLRECHRTTLWHRAPEDLVGQTLLFEWSNGSWRAGKVLEFDAEMLWHKVVYYRKTVGSVDETTYFNIHEGRNGRETGRVRVLPVSTSEEDKQNEEPINEREDGAYRVLEQLQRTFCFLKYSKRKYFDPRPLVEACKSLNLNFNVYHQNDATEFYDQLLDRIETATKGKHTKRNVWNEVFLKDVFGGKWLTQKIPQECEVFSKEKDNCGHWQSSRVEDYLKVELIVRGKEKIDDSLDGLIQGELMDGDNKIYCEVCCQKKTTTRRTCFGSLPNTLILHLKRFDLDFQTFETVKLNTKMIFPTSINMLKYTKEGIELAEAEKSANSPTPSEGQQQRTSKELSYQSDSNQEGKDDSSAFEYELQGILVHAGVAQGGHYYSFIKDDNDGKWYRFDDEDVTPFNPDNIPLQCFGGPSGNVSSGHHHNVDDDRTSNALMLFYVKKMASSRIPFVTSTDSQDLHQQLTYSNDPSHPSSSLPSDNIDGYQAFHREVMESNLQHLLTCYLVDPELHNFVRVMISA
jgi:ubiquitin C-terminal hydrolase